MTKYRKYALIIWLIIAISLVPVAVKIRTQGTASELEFIPETNADRTMKTLQEEFPQIPASTIIIVIQADDVRQSWTRELNDELTKQLPQSDIYAYNTTNSVFTIEEEINTKINESIEQTTSLIQQKLAGFLESAHDNLTLLRDAINNTNSMLYGTVGLLSATWWNISRTVYYLNNLTTAYTDGLNTTYSSIVETVTGINNITISVIYNQTNVKVGNVPLGVIMADPELNDYYSYKMALGIVNQTFTFLLDQQPNSTEQKQFFYSYLNVLNNSITNRLLTMQANNQSMASQYYPPLELNQTEISKAFQSQLIVLNQISNLVIASGNDTVSLLTTTLPPETGIVLSTAWNLAANPDLESLNNATLNIVISQLNTTDLAGSILPRELQGSGMEFNITQEQMIQLLAPLLSPNYNESVPTELSNQFVDSIKDQIYEAAPYVHFPDQYPEEIYRQFVSKDNSTMIFIITFNESSQKTEVQENTPKVRQLVNNALEKINPPKGTTIYVSGEVAMFYDLQKVSEEDIGKTDVYTVVMVIGVLIIIFLSPVTPFIPLFTIGIALIVVYAIFYALSLVTEIPTMMLTLTTVVMMGAGVDYLVFLLSRYKEEREVKNNSVEESIENTVVHAGESIITSGLSVAIGFGILMTSSIELLFWMGIGPLIGVIVSLAAALTIIPSLLSFLEDKIYWPRMHVKKAMDKTRQKLIEAIENNNGNKKNDNKKNDSFTRKGAQWIVDHPKTVVVLFLLASAPFVYAGINMQTSYDLTAQIPETQESVQGLTIMSNEFGASEVFPVYVLLTLQNPIIENNSAINQTIFNALENLRLAINALSSVSDTMGVTAPSGGETGLNVSQITPIELERLMAYVGKDNKTVYFLVKLSVDPLSEEGLNSVEQIQSVIESKLKTEPALKNAEWGVAGFGAQYLELNDYIEKDTPKLVALVLIGLFILLVFALRSIVTPIRLQLTILLGVYISLGITDLVFRQMLNEQISWMLPVTLFVMIFGLGMDYDIFLVTRIREEVKKGKTDKEATVDALVATSGIISAAGIIMATAFASLLFSELVTLRTIGFAIATAVLVDALFIRLILVPATMVLLEKWNWWLPFAKNKE